MVIPCQRIVQEYASQSRTETLDAAISGEEDEVARATPMGKPRAPRKLHRQCLSLCFFVECPVIEFPPGHAEYARYARQYVIS